MIVALIISLSALAVAWFVLCIVVRFKMADLKRQLKQADDERWRLKNQLTNAVADAEHRCAAYYQRAADNRIQQYGSRFAQENIDKLSESISKESIRAVERRVAAQIDKQFNKVGETFLGTLSDHCEAMTRDLQFALFDDIWDSIQNFKETSIESPALMPDGARVAYTKGKRTIVVVEQKPQVRTVGFLGNVLASRAVANLAVSTTDTSYRYTLAFPYVYFVLVFDDSKYQYHEVYFRNKPLMSVGDYVCLAPIPNVHRKYSNFHGMCMGNQKFRDQIHQSKTIAAQTEVVISEFWQRPFNGDLGDGNPGAVDARIKNHAVWQQNTEENPLFVLSVEWNKAKTLKGVIEGILDQRNVKEENPIEQKIKEKLSNGVATLIKQVKDQIASAKASKLKEKSLDEASREVFVTTIKEHANKVFEACGKV